MPATNHISLPKFYPHRISNNIPKVMETLYFFIPDNDACAIIVEIASQLEWNGYRDQMVIRFMKIYERVQINIHIYDWVSRLTYMCNFYVPTICIHSILGPILKMENNLERYFTKRNLGEEALVGVEIDMDACAFPRAYGNYLLKYEKIKPDRFGAHAREYYCGSFDDIGYPLYDSMVGILTPDSANSYLKHQYKCPYFIKPIQLDTTPQVGFYSEMPNVINTMTLF